MKILCVIDSLGSGGAQRQMVNLACGLKSKGHQVELLVYFPDLRFFRAEIDSAGITVHEVNKKKWKIISRVRSLLRLGSYDGVISFLQTPNFYCELAKATTFSRSKLIVSERSSFVRESGNMKQVIARYFHVFASAVIANSHTHARWLSAHHWLQKKTHTIYNGYPLPSLNINPKACRNHFSYLLIGRINAGKNGTQLIKSLARYYHRKGYCPKVAWAGRQENDIESLRVRDEMEKLLRQNPAIAEQWQWLGERDDIPELLQQCDALIHVSLFEGLPNVICEAFIAGRPVIASNICDHPILVKNGVRGILCDPLSPESICDAIDRFEKMTDSEITQLGINARRYAEDYLGIDRMVSEYEALLIGRCYSKEVNNHL